MPRRKRVNCTVWRGERGNVKIAHTKRKTRMQSEEEQRNDVKRCSSLRYKNVTCGEQCIAPYNNTIM